jgi:hypothetical protein
VHFHPQTSLLRFSAKPRHVIGEVWLDQKGANVFVDYSEMSPTCDEVFLQGRIGVTGQHTHQVGRNPLAIAEASVFFHVFG